MPIISTKHVTIGTYGFKGTLNARQDHQREMETPLPGPQLRSRSTHRRALPAPLSADPPSRTPHPERESGHRQGKCTADGCDQAEVARGYCFRHYQQIRRYGRLTPERERIYGRTKCQVATCQERHAARGYCKKHYMQEFYLPRRSELLEDAAVVA